VVELQGRSSEPVTAFWGRAGQSPVQALATLWQWAADGGRRRECCSRERQAVRRRSPVTTGGAGSAVQQEAPGVV
jgi:hypothetical protein